MSRSSARVSRAFGFVAGEQPLVDRAADAAAEADDAAASGGERRRVDPRPAVIEAVEVAVGDELARGCASLRWSSASKVRWVARLRPGISRLSCIDPGAR